MDPAVQSKEDRRRGTRAGRSIGARAADGRGCRMRLLSALRARDNQLQTARNPAGTVVLPRNPAERRDR